MWLCLEVPPAPFLENLEDENRTPVAPSFTSVIQDVEVVEGSAARFDCKIEGNDLWPWKLLFILLGTDLLNGAN